MVMELPVVAAILLEMHNSRNEGQPNILARLLNLNNI
jgi:hypothetical protein